MRTATGSTRNSRGSSFPNSDAGGRVRVRIGLVESDPLRVVGCRSAFDSVPNFEVVATSIAGLLLDRSLVVGLLGARKGQGLLDTIALLRQARPELKLITLGTDACYGGRGNQEPGCFVGSGGGFFPPSSHLHEGCSPRDLRRAVEAALSNHGYRPVPVGNRDGTRPVPSRPPTSPHSRSELQITRREQQVLDQLGRAWSNREIAASLGIEEQTVKGHVARLMRKAGVDNRTLLTFYAMRLGGDGGEAG